MELILTIEAADRQQAVDIAAHRARRYHTTPYGVKAAQQLGAVWRVVLLVNDSPGVAQR